MSPRRLVDLIKTVEAAADAASTTAYMQRDDPLTALLAEERAAAFRQVLSLLRLELDVLTHSMETESRP